MFVPTIPNVGAQEALNDILAHDADSAKLLNCGGDQEALSANDELMERDAHEADTAIDDWLANDAVVDTNDLLANDAVVAQNDCDDHDADTA